LKAEVDRIKKLISDSNAAKDEADPAAWSSKLSAAETKATASKNKYKDFWDKLVLMDAERNNYTPKTAG